MQFFTVISNSFIGRRLFVVLQRVLLVVSCWGLLACGSGDKDEQATPGSSSPVRPATSLSEQQVNKLLAETSYFGNQYFMSCTGSAVSGCFISPSCKRSSDSFSSRMVYSIEADTIEAFMVYYQTPFYNARLQKIKAPIYKGGNQY